MVLEMERLHVSQLGKRRKMRRDELINQGKLIQNCDMVALLKEDDQDSETPTNLVSAEFLSLLEAITSKSRNIKVSMFVAKLLDIILFYHWYDFREKDTWTTIYLINYIFDLHDIFHGSFLSQRLTRSAKKLVHALLEERQEDLAKNQE